MTKKYETRKLTYQLVPSTAWYTNLRSILPNWGEVSRMVRSYGKCAICGKSFDPSDLDAHEVWRYDDENHIQYLRKIIPVCDACHNSIHIGHAGIVGRSEEALTHYAEVNGISYMEAVVDMNEAFSDWDRHSNYEWTIDEQIVDKIEEHYHINCRIDKPIDGKYYVKVDYELKDEVKKFGAKFDWNRRMWYFNSDEDRQKWSAYEKELVEEVYL